MALATNGRHCGDTASPIQETMLNAARALPTQEWFSQRTRAPVQRNLLNSHHGVLPSRTRSGAHTMPTLLYAGARLPCQHAVPVLPQAHAASMPAGSLCLRFCAFCACGPGMPHGARWPATIGAACSDAWSDPLSTMGMHRGPPHSEGLRHEQALGCVLPHGHPPAGCRAWHHWKTPVGAGPSPMSP